MRNAVEDVLAHTGPETEVIAVCDSYWPEPTLQDHPRLQMIHFSEAVGQRAATNAGVSLSRAKYVAKLDAHCSVDDGFDVKMIERMEPDVTMIPAMHKLHAFDWVCECGAREYQGTKPDVCKCGKDFTMEMVWKPREGHSPTVAWRFDSELHFQYWRKHPMKPHDGLIETMTCIGACFLMERERFWELGGLDEGHGSWGQMGTELAAKCWLSGGRMVTNTTTWFAHLFRSGNFSRNGQSSWPYPISQQQIDHARQYSRDLWLNNAWPQQKYPLSWLLEKFWPVPGWTEDDLEKQKQRELTKVFV